VIFKLKDRKDFSLFMGPDTMMADSVLFGAAGGVNSGSNLYPEVYVNCYKCISSGDIEGARRHQDNINRIQKLYYFRRYIGLSVASSMKTGLKFRGICDNVMLPPIAPVTAETEAKVREIMDEIDANL
jgi:4-hydroxy-tetrahydrodipicolinate synthase